MVSEPIVDLKPRERMILHAAAALRNDQVCFVGIGLPSAAANLARRTHAPDLVLVYESGTIGARPQVLPLSIGDGELAATAVEVVSVPELFNYWLQPGRIDVGFLGAAQIDKFGNINTTVVGRYDAPSVRLPGAGGAPAIADFCGEVTVLLPHSTRGLVERVDFVTTYGYGRGAAERAERDVPGRGPVRVITDLAVLEPDEETRELVVTHLHPGVTVDQVRAMTGWSPRFADDLRVTAEPSAGQVNVLRELLGE